MVVSNFEDLVCRRLSSTVSYTHLTDDAVFVFEGSEIPYGEGIEKIKAELTSDFSIEFIMRVIMSNDGQKMKCTANGIMALDGKKSYPEYELSLIHIYLLTNILNRRAFHSILGKKLESPEEIKTAALVMLDLDNLKYINDTYGHDYGDDYLSLIHI